MSATINTLTHLRTHTHTHSLLKHTHSKSIKYVCCCLFVWHFCLRLRFTLSSRQKQPQEQQQKRNNIKEPVRSNVPCCPWRQLRLQVIVNMARGLTQIESHCLQVPTGSERNLNRMLNRFGVAKLFLMVQ